MRVSARVGRRPKPDAVSSAPNMTVRRDARHCVTAEGLKVDVAEGRMRFVPVLHEFITGRGPWPVSHFQDIRGFIAVRIRLSGSGQSRSRRISHGESRSRRRSGAVGREREEQGIIAMDHWIASARLLGRALAATLAGILTTTFVAAPALAQQQPKAPAQKQAAAQKQAPAAQPPSRARSRRNPGNSRPLAISRSSCIRPG